jgi:RNA polymerase sigma-70 factor, ECF subfamily
VSEAGFITGHDDSFGRRLAAQGPRLMRVARCILRDADWSEDAVAETFLRAWARRRSLRTDRKLAAWVFSICRRVSLSLLRKRRGQEPLTDGQIETQSASASRAAADAAEEHRHRRELLERLPAELKTCAVMFFVDGRNYSEIASITALPLSTVRGRIYQSRQRLRKEIEMTSMRTTSRTPTCEPELRPQAGRLTWRGMRIRFLGIGWTGSRRLCDAAGRRLTRVPGALKECSLFLHPPGAPGKDRYKLSAFWEMAGCASGPSACGFVSPLSFDPAGATSHQGMLPLTNQAENAGGRGILCVLCGQPPKDDRYLHFKGTLLGEEEGQRALRFLPEDPADQWGSGWVATANPEWGCCFMTDRRPGKEQGTCTFTVALSTNTVETAWHVVVVGPGERECEPTSVSGGWCTTPSGRLMVKTLDVGLPPEGVKGIVVHPLQHVEIDWGRIRIPPEEL